MSGAALAYDQAVSEMRAGRRVTRAAWGKSKALELPMVGGARRGGFVQLRAADGSVKQWECTPEDVTATDYEVIP